MSKLRVTSCGLQVIANCLLLTVSCMLFFPQYLQAEEEVWTGRGLMDEVFKRHEMFPYVFEEQTMILMDSAGHRDIRKVRRFSRVEDDGTAKYLLVFDNPVEVRGVALLATYKKSGQGESSVYLPALDKKLISNTGNSRGSHFFGTDFSIEDMAAEILSEYRYDRKEDFEINKILHYVVEAFPVDKEVERTTRYSFRKHFIRQDNFFIVRTDFFDRRGRFFKRLTSHDLKQVDGDMWRANMILMSNHKERHKTLLKINSRIFSRDYVPAEMFTSSWLLENKHLQGLGDPLFRNVPTSLDGKDEELLKAAESADQKALEEGKN